MPGHRKFGVLFGLFSLTSQALCQPVWPNEPLRVDAQQFTVERLRDGRRLLLGPYPPHGAPVSQQTCAELYAERVRLMHTQYDYRPAFTDDPRNRAAVFIGTIFTPAFYFLAFSGIQAYGDANDDAETRVALQALSYASAEQRCFER